MALSAYGVEDYRNFIYEGMRLKENCKNKEKGEPAHSTPWQKQQVKRSVYSTLQYLGLETSIKFLSLYSRHFGFTEDEYAHLGKGLIGNYCSSNMTIMSRTTLKKKWIASFHHPSDRLPYHEGRDIFKHFSPLFVDKKKIEKKEFSLTVELFKTFCSWGNDPDDLRLLVPLIRNPAVMAFIFRHLTHTKLEWNEKAGELLYRTNTEASSISCKNLICRRDHYKRFIISDLNQLYCQNLRDVDYKRGSGVPPKIQKIIATISEPESQLMTSHFISLLTRTPNFFLYAEKFSDIERFARMPMEQHLKKWLIGNKQFIDPEFFHEEHLSLDTIPASPPRLSFKIAFQVNFGEWDKAVNALGRIRRVLNLNVFKNVLKNAQKIDAKNPEQTASYLKKMLRHQIIKIHSQTPLPLSPVDWVKRVVGEISAQIQYGRKTLDFDDGRKTLSIPIEIYYSPFALQYIHRQNLP